MNRSRLKPCIKHTIGAIKQCELETQFVNEGYLAIPENMIN